MLNTFTLNPNNWVELYSDYLYHYTITRVNDSALAQDLVQDTFLAGLKSLKNFKGEANERTWLTAILKRKIIDHYRKINSAKGKAEMRVDFSANTDQDENWLEKNVADILEKNIEDQILNTELGEAIFNCLSKLSLQQAQIFRMKTLENIETEKICKELEISSTNLWVIVHRARTAMANCLKENWF